MEHSFEGTVPMEHSEDVMTEHSEDVPIEHSEDVRTEHSEDVMMEHSEDVPVNTRFHELKEGTKRNAYSYQQQKFKGRNAGEFDRRA